MGELLVVLGVLLIIFAGGLCFIVALAMVDSRPTHVVHVVERSSVGDQLEAEFRALDKQ